MEMEKVLNARTQEEARQFAIEWQNWQAKQNMSWEEVADWMYVFVVLADALDLQEEFTENGII